MLVYLSIRQKLTDLIVAMVYVDDAMFFGKNKTLVMKKKQEFMDTWECQDLGEVQEFLRMRIKCKGNKIVRGHL